MLRHLRSTAASASSHSPPPPPSPAPTEDDNEENARAIAVSDQRTIYLVNMFIANTVEFLNSFAALCNDKLALLHRKIVQLDSSLTLLETKLHSIDDTNALGHSTSQKAQQCFTHEDRFDPANLFSESSRYLSEYARAIWGSIQPAHYSVLHRLYHVHRWWIHHLLQRMNTLQLMVLKTKWLCR